MEISHSHRAVYQHSDEHSILAHPRDVHVHHNLVHPISVSEYKEFISSTTGRECSIRYALLGSGNINLSRVTSLGIAFGVAGAVFMSACGAAFNYLSGKVEEERTKMNKEPDSSES